MKKVSKEEFYSYFGEMLSIEQTVDTSKGYPYGQIVKTKSGKVIAKSVPIVINSAKHEHEYFIND